MLRLVDERRPDVIVAEPCELSSRVAAARHGIPFVMASIGMGSGLERQLGGLLAGVLDELGERAGVTAVPGPQPPPQITRAPRALEDPDAPEDPPGLLRVRYPRGASTAPTEPLVYVSFGSEIPVRAEGWFPRLYRAVADALADVPAHVLLAVGDQRHPADLGPLPANAHAEQWVAQADVLARAAVMVGHGGAGSTLDALAAGVPMALVPLFADQPINARIVTAAGAGRAFAEDDIEALGAGVRAMLAEPGHRDAARGIAAEMAALPPIEAAVAFLERAVVLA
jgi:UDP:flavonoid glycosyltransferase YjiC (YdhE family)